MLKSRLISIVYWKGEKGIGIWFRNNYAFTTNVVLSRAVGLKVYCSSRNIFRIEDNSEEPTVDLLSICAFAFIRSASCTGCFVACVGMLATVWTFRQLPCTRTVAILMIHLNIVFYHIFSIRRIEVLKFLKHNMLVTETRVALLIRA